MATLQNILELAKRGSPKAIAVLMNRHLQSKGIIAKADLRGGCLQVLLESEQVLDQLTLVAFIRRGVTNLGTEAIKKVRVYGKQTSEKFPAWIQEIELIPQTPISPIATTTTKTIEVGAAQLKKTQVNRIVAELGVKPAQPKKTQVNRIVAELGVKPAQPKKTQVSPIVAEPGVKPNTKRIQNPITAVLPGIKRTKIVVESLIVGTSVSVIFLLISPVNGFKKDYREADCSSTYKAISNIIIGQRNNINILASEQKSLVLKSNNINKMVVSVKSKYPQLRDERLKLVTEQFIKEAKTESESLRKVFLLEKSESKLVELSDENAFKNKLEFENARAIQAFFNQLSLIKDGALYCRYE